MRLTYSFNSKYSSSPVIQSLSINLFNKKAQTPDVINYLAFFNLLGFLATSVFFNLILTYACGKLNQCNVKSKRKNLGIVKTDVN